MIQDCPGGLDSSWTALDQLGQVGVFFTGGEGPIPRSALLGEAETEDLEKLLRSLPLVGAATRLVAYPRPDDLVAMAKRGLFALDWREVPRVASGRSRKYELIASPGAPITSPLLARETRSAALRTCFGNLILGRTPAVAIAQAHDSSQLTSRGSRTVSLTEMSQVQPHRWWPRLPFESQGIESETTL
jgi:hypothetical protein